MGKGLLAQWRRGIVARGFLGAALLAVPVAMAAAIGFGTSLSGIAGGLSSFASGPDNTTTTETAPRGLNRAVAALTSRPESSDPGQGGGDSVDDGGDTTGGGNTTGGGTITGGSGGSGGSDGGSTATIDTPQIDLPGGGGGTAGGTLDNTVNGVNGVLEGVGNTVNGILGQ